jgi:hypothetical protein
VNAHTFNVTPFKLVFVDALEADFCFDKPLALTEAENRSLFTITPGLQSLEVAFSEVLVAGGVDDTRLGRATGVDKGAVSVYTREGGVDGV